MKSTAFFIFGAACIFAMVTDAVSYKMGGRYAAFAKYRFLSPNEPGFGKLKITELERSSKFSVRLTDVKMGSYFVFVGEHVACGGANNKNSTLLMDTVIPNEDNELVLKVTSLEQLRDKPTTLYRINLPAILPVPVACGTFTVMEIPRY